MLGNKASLCSNDLHRGQMGFNRLEHAAEKSAKNLINDNVTAIGPDMCTEDKKVVRRPACNWGILLLHEDIIIFIKMPSTIHVNLTQLPVYLVPEDTLPLTGISCWVHKI